MKQKRPQIGDLVRIVGHEERLERDRTYSNRRLGLIIGHYGIRSKVEWSDGTYSEPMRAALEVL